MLTLHLKKIIEQKKMETIICEINIEASKCEKISKLKKTGEVRGRYFFQEL